MCVFQGDISLNELYNICVHAIDTCTCFTVSCPNHILAHLSAPWIILHVELEIFTILINNNTHVNGTQKECIKVHNKCL